MSLTWATMRTRLYGLCNLSSQRVGETKIDEWLTRGISQIADVAKDHPILWDALAFLETKEQKLIDDNGIVSLPEQYLHLFDSMTVRGRVIRMRYSSGSVPLVQDSFSQPTIEEPWAIITVRSTDGSTRDARVATIAPNQFAGQNVMFRYLKQPTTSTEVTEEVAELLLASAAMIAHEELRESELYKSAAIKYGMELSKLGIRLQ